MTALTTPNRDTHHTGSMRRVSAGSVGSATARAVHGWSFGADCVVLADSPVPGSSIDETGPRSGSPRRDDRTDDHLEATSPLAADPEPVGAAADPATVLTRVCQADVVHRANSLDRLADLAESGTGPLVIADADLRLDLPGHLDLLDVPGDPTAALLADPHQIEGPRQRFSGIAGATVARVGADGAAIESSATSGHTVIDPNRVVVGLLRISDEVRWQAAHLWRHAAQQATAAESMAPTGPDLFDLALLAVVRGGLRVGNQPVGFYSWSRRGLVVSGSGGGPWHQRLRSASRTGDGPYSTAAIRPLSRLVTRLSLRLNVTPNTLTMLSVAIGIATALLIMAGATWAWVAAAFGLQLALVIDCCDGEVARFTRRFSTFGGWLDGIGDRGKEYLVFAALAAAASGGRPVWLLAMIAMAVVTARHLEDYAYHDRNAASRASVAAPRPLQDPTDGGTGATTLPGPVSPAMRRRFWLKKLAHVPIAERYLILSLGLLAGQPWPTLIAAIAVSGFALCWTVGGRLLAAIRTARATPQTQIADGGEPDPQTPESARTSPRLQPLDHQLDLGVLARVVVGGRGPLVAGTVLLVALWLVTAGAIGFGPGTGSWTVLGTALSATALIGSAWQAPLRHRLGWLTLPLIWLAEAGVVAAMLAYGGQLGHWGLVCFIVLAAICCRRYELMYSIRLLGPPGRRTGWLGAEGRILAVAGIAALASWLSWMGGPAPSQVAVWGMLALAAETLAEAVLSTARSWWPGRRTQANQEH